MIDTGISWPESSISDPEFRVLPPSLRSKQLTSGSARFKKNLFLWPHCAAANQLEGHATDSLLGELSQHLIGEGLYIEKLGMAFAAKMNLASETTAERLFYAQMSGEEAHHYALLQSLLDGSAPAAAEQPFLLYLDQLIREEEKPILAFLVQVLLEGWGLVHYSRLAQNACQPAAQAMFHSILVDEKRHHAMGILKCDQATLSPSLVDQLVHHASTILTSVQVGPVHELRALEKHLGFELSDKDLRLFFSHGDVRRKIQNDLDLLLNCMGRTTLGQAIRQVLPSTKVCSWSDEALVEHYQARRSKQRVIL